MTRAWVNWNGSGSGNLTQTISTWINKGMRKWTISLQTINTSWRVSRISHRIAHKQSLRTLLKQKMTLLSSFQKKLVRRWVRLRRSICQMCRKPLKIKNMFMMTYWLYLAKKVRTMFLSLTKATSKIKAKLIHSRSRGVVIISQKHWARMLWS